MAAKSACGNDFLECLAHIGLRIGACLSRKKAGQNKPAKNNGSVHWNSGEMGE
jgi:hypothetical protein